MTTQQKRVNKWLERRQLAPPPHRYVLVERDIQTFALETNNDNAYVFSESDCTPATDLAKSVRRSLLTQFADGINDLAQVIEPLELPLLLDGYFGKRPVVLKAKENHDRFSRFYSRNHIKTALDGLLIDPDHMKVVTAKGEFCTEAFLKNRTRMRKSLGDRIVDFVEKNGGTFNVSRIYNHSSEVAGLVHILNRAFKARISASAFFTGSHGQAFPVHWDTFDTFIFQVEGKKNWTVYEPLIHAPLPDVHYCTRYDIQNLTSIFDIELVAGDLMIVPRGYPHRARTKRSNSIHMTIGIHTPTWHDCFSTILNRALIETRSFESFRSDCHVCHAPLEVRKRYILTMLNQFVEIAKSVIHSDYFLDHCVVDSGMKTDGVATGERPLNEDTLFYRGGGFCFIDRVGNHIHFRYNTTKLVLPSYAFDTLEFMTTKTKFRLRDLPSALTKRSQKLLVKKMCSIGFLLT